MYVFDDKYFGKYIKYKPGKKNLLTQINVQIGLKYR